MSSAKPNKDNHVVAKRTSFGSFIDFILKAIGVLVASAIVSVCIEWIGMTFFYPDEGYHHAERMMQNEIRYLGGSVDENSLNGDAVGTASNAVESVVSFLFIDSGLIDNLNSVHRTGPNEGRIIRSFKALVREYYDYLMAAVYILIMFVIRMAILILSIPAFMLFGLVGICDGLMQRDLRRWQGGNESGFVYHWAKRFALPVLVICWILYLAIPNSIHPNYIITPFAALFGLVLMVMTSKFKKYL